MNRYSLTPTFVVILIGMLAFVYYDRDTLCVSGTPTLNASVQNYINTKVAKLASGTNDKSGSGKSLKDVTERLFALDRTSAAALESATGLEIFKRLLPEEVFDFEDIPLLEHERRERSTEILDFVCARVRRTCREGIK